MHPHDYLLSQLPLPLNKARTQHLQSWVGNDPERLRSLVGLFLGPHTRITQGAARILSRVAEQHPAMLEPYLPGIVQALSTSPTDAVKRNVVRLLQWVQLPENLQGQVAAHCFAYLQNPKEAIAIRAFSITVLARLCGHQPELGRELQLVLEDALHGAGPAIRQRVREARKKLQIVAA